MEWWKENRQKAQASVSLSPTPTMPWGMDGTLAWGRGCLDAWP